MKGRGQSMTWGELKQAATDTPNDANVNAYIDKFFDTAEPDWLICDYFEVDQAMAETEMDR